ncbi:MAG: type II toxin-antitoxin system VapC family toxin [Gammaproteobacteria bacterium]|nr:type II toxin-antitoxin system VapC family toxin [Gammaproteobacteria bacterium]NIR85555.1 type II toxin-antitoxin system VapC family toxin [Gammaproteobacteria bacterium]NIU06698.1 type II toxin-antitoxin system VapC family toxin [Gammaproteobacteria bacterium]NIX87971.1 PIN domain-containing protein [Gammaproteobacteria bacterium]
MNVVDSSGWLEYFADAANAEFFAPAILDTEALLVPSISLLEVFKRVYQQRDENAALSAAALMRQGKVVALDGELALTAAKLSADHKLPLADSVMLATARAHDATLWTQDADFESFEGVRYVSKH